MVTIYRNNAGRLGAVLLSVCLETRWLGHLGGFHVPGCYCTLLEYDDWVYVMLWNTLVLWGLSVMNPGVSSGGTQLLNLKFQFYDTSPRILNWPYAWACCIISCTRSYNISVSVKKTGEGVTGRASDIIKAEKSEEDPRATGGLVSNPFDPRVNTTQQHIL